MKIEGGFTIKVTLEHIRAAKPTLSSSPIALALREMGYSDAIVTHHYAYIEQNVYVLPDIASDNEIRFDFLAKQGKIQGETLEELKAYEFKLGAKINV